MPLPRPPNGHQVERMRYRLRDGDVEELERRLKEAGDYSSSSLPFYLTGASGFFVVYPN